MKLFDGFVRISDDKRPLVKSFKDNTNLLTEDEVKNSRGIAGKLAYNTVLIDIDNEEQGEILLKIVKSLSLYCQVRKTNRGYHFYFKNNGWFKKCETRKRSAIGLTVDIKVGYSPSLGIIRLAGKDRQIVYDKFVPDTEDYQNVPHWLRVVQSDIELIGKDDGDGRNDALFRYIIHLMRSKFTISECRETIKIINKYVFSKSLSDKELSTITRDEAFKEMAKPVFFDGKHFLHNEFADFLVNELQIKRIDGVLHTYSDGVYISGEKIITHHMIRILPTLRSSQRAEVLKHIESDIIHSTERSSANFIAFKNGVLDLENYKLLPFSPEYVITNKIPWDYNPHAKVCDAVELALNQWACGDSSIRAVLEELAGYCMYRRNELRKAFILIGNKGNGKSTFMDMIGTMVGRDNFSALDLRDLSDRFRLSLIVGKLANLGDDISSEPLKDTSIFKKIVTGDPMTTEQKNIDAFTFSSYAKLVFCANSFPQIYDPTGAVFDRLIVIPFNATFKKENQSYIPYLKDSLRTQDAIEYFITLCIKGLNRVIKNNGFSYSSEVEKTTRFYKTRENSVLAFVDSINTQEIEQFPCSVWYDRYTQFCEDTDCKPLSNPAFGRGFKSQLNLKSISRKQGRSTAKFYQLKR